MTDKPINTKRILLSAHPKFLNFKAIKGISATNKRLVTNARVHKTYGFNIKSLKPDIYSWDKKVLSIVKINGIEQINMALAGVGKPMKESDWRVSLLNLAKRIAEKIGIINAK